MTVLDQSSGRVSAQEVNVDRLPTRTTGRKHGRQLYVMDIPDIAAQLYLIELGQSVLESGTEEATGNCGNIT